MLNKKARPCYLILGCFPSETQFVLLCFYFWAWQFEKVVFKIRISSLWDKYFLCVLWDKCASNTEGVITSTVGNLFLGCSPTKWVTFNQDFALLYAWGQYPGDSEVTNGYSGSEMKDKVRQKKHTCKVYFSKSCCESESWRHFPPPKYPAFGGCKMDSCYGLKKRKVMVTPFLSSLKDF